MLKIHTKKNILFYQDEYDNIKELVVYKTDKKFKIKEAEEFLSSQGIRYKRLINVFFEDMTLFIPKDHISKYIRK